MNPANTILIAIAGWFGGIAAANGFFSTVAAVLPLPICFAVQSALDADVDIYRALHEVNQSNFSKFCTDDQIQPTIDKYQALGVTLRFDQVEGGLSAAYVESAVDTVKYPIGKLMKSVGYLEPDLRWVNATT